MNSRRLARGMQGKVRPSRWGHAPGTQSLTQLWPAAAAAASKLSFSKLSLCQMSIKDSIRRYTIFVSVGN